MEDARDLDNLIPNSNSFKDITSKITESIHKSTTSTHRLQLVSRDGTSSTNQEEPDVKLISSSVKQELDFADFPDEMDDDDFIGGEIYPDTNGESIVRREQPVMAKITGMDTLRCANCELLLKIEELGNCNNLHQIISLESNAEDDNLVDIELIDVISDIFNLRRSCDSYKEIYKRDDLYLCAECSTILVKMYQLYRDFKSLAVKSNAFLITFLKNDKCGCSVSKENENIKPNYDSSAQQRIRKSGRTTNLPKKLQHSSSSETEVETTDNDIDGLSELSYSRTPQKTGKLRDSNESKSKMTHNVKKTNCKKLLPRCDDCNISFKFSIQLVNHLRSHAHKSSVNQAIIASESGNVTSKTATSEHLKKPSFCCPQSDCKKSFAQRKSLQCHMKSHWDDSAGECDRCGKKFKTLGGLKIHFASHVRDDQKKSCKMCGKKFRKQEALDMHVKIDHTGFKPHRCPHPTCEKAFRLKDKLKLHLMVMHEKKRPHPCAKCEKSYRTKYHLKIHDVSQHQQQGGDNSIGCSQCKRKFFSRQALEKHVLIHDQEKPYICDACGKGFQTAARLRLHEKSHQKVPSCLCSVCGRSYKHHRDLRLHEILHQDESTYRFGCGDCSRRFYRIDLLRVHQSNEKHFSTETIGPTMSKVLTNKEPEVVVNESVMDDDDDDDDDENETDTETVPPPPPPSPKKKLKSIKEDKSIHFLSPRTKNMTLAQPNHTTVIYHPSRNMVQLQLEQPNVSSASGLKNNGTTFLSSSSLPYISHCQPQHHSNEVLASTSYLIAQRDQQNILHHPAIQIQASQIQFGNQTVYTSQPVNMPNITTESTGFDFINSFNLG